MFNNVVHVIAALVLVFYVWNMRKVFAIKPNSSKLANLRRETLYRLTSKSALIDNCQVHLTPTPGLIANISAGCKPVTWFFVGEPSEWQKAVNSITSYEIQLEIPFDRLDEHFVLYRKYDNVIGYTKEYEGQASIQFNPKSKGMKYRIIQAFELLKTAIELLIAYFCLIFLFDIIGYIIIGLFYLLLIVLFCVDKYNKHRIKKLSENP